MQTPRPLTKVLRYLRQLDPGGSTDGHLLRQFADKGDEDAFAQLVRRHGGLVLGVCRRILRHHQDAEDAAQAAFVVLARKAGSISWEESVAGWLHEVAVRVALEARSRIARRRGLEQAMEALPEKATLNDIGQGNISEVLDQELSRLPDKFRTPLVLCYLEGRTRDEAGEQLGWTLSQVKSRLERGREMLRGRLARRGLTLGAVLASAMLSSSANAAVPAGLVSTTLALAASQGASAPALEIAAVILKTMFLAKVKKATVVVLAILTLSLGVGFLGQHGLTRPEPVQQKNAEPAKELDKKADSPEDPKPVLTMKHGGPARGAVFLPDGKRLVTCSFDGTFRLWDVKTGKETFRWEIRGANSAVTVSRDGKRIAGGNADGELLIWDADTGKELAARRTRQGNIYSLAFSPDGRWLASANHSGTVSLWDGQTGAKIRHMDAHEGRAWAVAFSPDGKRLASSGEDGLVFLWDPETGKELHKLEGHSGQVGSLAFSPDGKKLVSADMEDTFRNAPPPDGLQDTIRIWETGSGKQLLAIKTPLTHFVTFSPEGKNLVSCDRAGTIHLWTPETGKRRMTLKGHNDLVMCVHFDSSGHRLVSSGQDGAVHIWMLEKAR